MISKNRGSQPKFWIFSASFGTFEYIFRNLMHFRPESTQTFNCAGLHRTEIEHITCEVFALAFWLGPRWAPPRVRFRGFGRLCVNFTGFHWGLNQLQRIWAAWLSATWTVKDRNRRLHRGLELVIEPVTLTGVESLNCTPCGSEMSEAGHLPLRIEHSRTENGFWS